MLSLIKLNLRLDEQYKYEDELLEHYIETAKDYFYGATGKKFDEKNSIHKNIVILLVTHFYENRNIAITEGVDSKLTSMFFQAGLQRVDNDEYIL